MHLRFRSNQRNETVDLARLEAVRVANSAALTSVKSESAGLKERISDLTFSLAIALEDSDEFYVDREPQAEKELAFLERQLLEAEKRSATLDRQLRILIEVDSLLRDGPGCAAEA